MKPKRKLLTHKGFELLQTELDRGVPLKRALVNLGIDCTAPTAKQLTIYYKTKSPHLTPPWLDQEGPILQECPIDWRFKGFFPLTGEWICSKQ